MKSIREIYKIGRGPSSSHTMGPDRAARLFAAENTGAQAFRAVLYGSLAKTGRGHGTDTAISDAFAPRPCEILFDPDSGGLPHPNTLDLIALNDGVETARMRVLSVGGGDITILGRPEADPPDVYPHSSFAEIAEHCRSRHMRLSDYVEAFEGPGIWDFLADIWRAMRQSASQGLAASGTLPGGLGVERKARFLYDQKHIDESPDTRVNRIVCAYAFAVAEQNAGGGTIVTAPTCGSCGVMPAALLYTQEERGFSDKQLLRALAVGGLIGDLIKTNASISGAQCGCQAEIGSACSMAAAALGELFELRIGQIEYAAEVAMEHHLGLTCDPIGGLVQIPCIERNAVAAMRAINALSLANFLSSTRKISFDLVVDTMYQTGLDMSHRYRETSEGGLAKLYIQK